MIHFKNISKTPCSEWALTVKGNFKYITEEDYIKYLTPIEQQCTEFKHSYEEGKQDRLHIHSYLKLKQPKNKFQIKALTSPPKGWSVDFSPIVNKNGWLEYMNKEQGIIYQFPTEEQQNNYELSLKHPERTVRIVPKRTCIPKHRRCQILYQLKEDLKMLFPNARFDQIIKRKYKKLIMSEFPELF